MLKTVNIFQDLCAVNYTLYIHTYISFSVFNYYRILRGQSLSFYSFSLSISLSVFCSSSCFYAPVFRSTKVIELFGWWTSYPNPKFACCCYISESRISFVTTLRKGLMYTFHRTSWIFLYQLTVTDFFCCNYTSFVFKKWFFLSKVVRTF
jgi:hypothetical protein